MLVKFFTHGRGDQGSKPASGKSATRYLLGNLSHDGTQRSVEPELLRGDPNIFEEIVGMAGTLAGIPLAFSASQKRRLSTKYSSKS